MTDTTAGGRTPVRSTRQLVRGGFGWFLAGRTVDLFGSSMSTVALALAVLQASGHATDLGVVLASNMAPGLALRLLGGTVADRVSRRRLLIGLNLLNAAVMGLLAAVLIIGAYALWLVAGLSAVDGAASAFTTPALRGIVPELVGNADLQKANALLASSRNAVRIIAPSLAGTVVTIAGGGWAIAADAASFLLAAIALSKIPPRLPPARSAGLWHDVRDGWRTFTRMRWVVVMTASFALLNAANVGPWNVLGPLLVTRHAGAGAWGAVLSVRAAGLLLMSAFAVRLALRHPLRAGRLAGTLAALPLLALGLTTSTWAVAAAAFAGGLGFTLSSITWETALGRHVPGDSLSRVAAYDDLVSYAAIPCPRSLLPYSPRPTAWPASSPWRASCMPPCHWHRWRTAPSVR